MYTIVGLGNPGDEYTHTRHNMGRIILENFAKKNDFFEWELNKKLKAMVSKGEVGKNKVTLVEPETFMNKSGLSVKPFLDKQKPACRQAGKAEKLIVIYDDIDLPFGTFKIAFNKGSGGHKGVDSIIKSIRTKEFIRIRVGICPVTPAGKLKKPKTEQKVLDLIMKDFKKPELDVIKKLSKNINEALIEMIQNGRVSAMNKFN